MSLNKAMPYGNSQPLTGLDSPFSIISLGDYMTGENLHHFRRGIPEKFRCKYDMLLAEQVKTALADCDLLFLNFESSLLEYETLRKLPIEQSVYTAPLETLSLLKSLQVPVIANVANNHFSQHGSERALYTINKLEANDITVIGKNAQPVCLSLKGINLKIWGVSLARDPHFNNSYFKSSYDELPGQLNLPEKETGEYRVISIHWGNEYETIENKAQHDLALKLSEAGFDLILGHHPHTVQPVQKIGNAWVVYSHGNFLFDQNFSALTQKGLVTKMLLPENELSVFLSQQKDFRVVELSPLSIEELRKFCKENYSKSAGLSMRFKMKLELLSHFYELNYPIIKTFGNRLLKRKEPAR